MSLQIVRRFRGNLYGSIDISALEDRVIAHPAFQRLRRIKQTAFLNLVFPGASHTRFEHSLGVMHQTSISWQKISDNQRRLKLYCEQYPDFATHEAEVGQAQGLLAPTFPLLDGLFNCQYTLQALRLAALLHDIGHPSYSHSGERFLPTFDQIRQANADCISPFLHDYLDRSSKQSLNQQVSHETMTMVIFDQLLADIYQSNYNDLRISAQDIASILCLQIDPEEDSPLRKNGSRRLCHELVSGEIDVDRMDYLRRDSKECGVIYGIFDCDRIIDSLSIYQNPITEQLHLAIQYSGLAAFEDYLRARQSMYVQLYFHKTSVAAEAMLQAISRLDSHLYFPAKIKDYLRIDDGNAHDYLIAQINGEKSAESKKKVTDIFEDLVFRRRLWKRIYEVTFHKNVKDCPEIAMAKKILLENNISYECISSSVNLTKFTKRRQNAPSHNYLGLIKKDGKQFPRVVPIEDYSRLIQDDSTVEISRIYLDTSRPGDVNNLVLEAKKSLNSVFFS